MKESLQNVYDIVEKLNQWIYEKYDDPYNQFGVCSNGYMIAVEFNRECIWDSENDEREFYEDINEYEDLETHIKLEFNKYIDTIKRYKFYNVKSRKQKLEEQEEAINE